MKEDFKKLFKRRPYCEFIQNFLFRPNIIYLLLDSLQHYTLRITKFAKNNF